MLAALWDVQSLHINPGFTVNLHRDGLRLMCFFRDEIVILVEDCLDSKVNGLASAFFGSSCLFQSFEARRIFIGTLFTFFGLSGHIQLFLSLEVCPTGFLVLGIKSSLGKISRVF